MCSSDLGIPVIAPLSRDLLANEVTAVTAIFNGTTNYMLTAMAQQGADYEDVLAEAQELGYAEPDPTADVEGIDASFKLAVLCGLAFNVDVAPADVAGIEVTISPYMHRIVGAPYDPSGDAQVAAVRLRAAADKASLDVVLKIGSVPTGPGDRPKQDVKITGSRVLVTPK